MDDRWDDGDDYEPFIGRWSSAIAARFLDEITPPQRLRWIDVGCGTGALTAALLETSPVEIVGIDPSAGFLAGAARRLGAAPNVTLETAGGDAIPFGHGEFDAAVSGLVLNFLPDANRMLSEMVRVTRPGGLVALYVWDYAGEMAILRRFWDAAVAIDQSALDLDEGRRFPICEPTALASAADAAGLHDHRVSAIDATADFTGFDDYWTPFLGGQGPAPTYVAGLDDATRNELCNRLQLDVAPDPSAPFSLPIRAWALIGSTPVAI